MRWIICRRCDKAVPSEYIQSHLSTKHRIYCSDDTLDSIVSGRELMSLDSIITFREDTTGLKAAIVGILTRKGHKCVKCGHCTPVWSSMTAHFVKKHDGMDVKDLTEHGVEMQAPFGGRLKKWFEIIDRSTIEVDEENESPWEAVKVLLAKNRRRGRASTQLEENVRLVTGFVARTRWDILIEGHDKKQLMALAAMAKEKDRLHRVMEISGKYFMEISDKLRVGDVLLRRKIESEGYVTASHRTDDQRRAGKHAVQGERSEEHSDWKFKDVCTIAVFSDTDDRSGSIH
jgi:Orsellinic acid/F9775 biosynthesis cluster protein D